MLKALVKANIQSIVSGIFAKRSKKRGAASTALFVILFLYVFVCFFGLFAMMFSSLCDPFYYSGIGWLYFSVAGIMAFALCFIGSVFTAKQQLFAAKDNELLLSMPIPPYAILISRMLSLLALNYIFSALVLLPAGVVWCVKLPVTAMGVAAFILCFIFLPFMSLALSSVFGWILALIESRLRSKNIVSIVFSLAFLAAYFYFYTRIQIYLNILIANGEAIGAAIRRAVPPAYHMGAAIADGNIASLLLFILFCLAPIAVVTALLSRNFIRIATSQRGTARVKYREGKIHAGSAKSALFRKDMRHLLGSSSYLLNAGIGVVFIIAVALFIAFKNDSVMSLVEMLDSLGISAASAACIAYTFCCSMVIVTAPSISLEAKTLWILRSVPVRSRDILLAKANTHIAFCIPFILVGAVITSISLKAAALETFLLFALPFFVSCFIGYFGLMMNLKFPKFDWISETQAVKQSMSPILTMFGSMAIIIIPIIVYILLPSGTISVGSYLAVCTAAFAILSLLLRQWLVTAGAKKFEEL